LPSSIYKTPEGAARIGALYDEALAALGVDYESRWFGTRSGETHVLVVGPEDAPPVVFLPGGNFLNPTCLRWLLPLAQDYRLYAPDIVGQPGRSAQHRPFSKGDGHAFWVEDVMSGLGFERVPLVGLSYGAGIAIRAMGVVPERISRAALVSPSAVATGPVARMLLKVVVPMLLYRLRPTDEHLLRAAEPLMTEPEEPVIRQLGAVYEDVRLDTDLPRAATAEELEGFTGPVAVFASENDVFFPARSVLARARHIFPNLTHAECLEGCRHIPSGAALGRVNERIRGFLAGRGEI
jgi:pimeloyl-ACP methyl ester carboxylesterase